MKVINLKINLVKLLIIIVPFMNTSAQGLMEIEPTYFSIFQEKYELLSRAYPEDVSHQLGVSKEMLEIQGVKNIMEYSFMPTSTDNYMLMKLTFSEYINEFDNNKIDFDAKLKIFLKSAHLKLKMSEITNFKTDEFWGYKTIGLAKEKKDKIYIVFYFLQDIYNKNTGFFSTIILKDKEYFNEIDDIIKSIRKTK